MIEATPFCEIDTSLKCTKQTKDADETVRAFHWAKAKKLS
jgi:hypothetical protein